MQKLVDYYEMGVSKEVGLKGRRFATKSGHIGAFALPKLLRYAARMDMPGAKDLDFHASHVQALWELAAELQTKSLELRALRESRDALIDRYLRGVMPETDEGYDSYKQVILAVLNGMSTRTSWPLELQKLAAECAAIRNMLANKYPELVKELRQRKRRDLVVSATSILMMDLERKYLDRMVEAAGTYLISVEHDGIVALDAPDDVIFAIVASVPWPVCITTYPQSRN